MSKSRSRCYGQAGEYYVPFRLWESEIVAMMVPPGAPRVDILLYDQGYKLIGWGWGWGWCQTLFLVLTCCLRNQKQSLTPMNLSLTPMNLFAPADAQRS